MHFPHLPSRPPEKKEVTIINETFILIEGIQYKKHDHEKEELQIIEHLIRENSRLIGLLGRIIPEPPPPRKIRPTLAFNLLINNKNFNFMSVVTNLTLTSTAPITLFMTVVDANNNNAEIAGVLSGLSYNADTAQDIAVVDPNDPLSVDIHAIAPQGGTTVTGIGNFVSTLVGPDGTTPAFSGSVTGTLVLVNNVLVGVLKPVLAFNQ